MSLPKTPHYDLPFHYDSINFCFAQVQQDTTDDIYNCVHAVTRTHPLQRTLSPEFGVLDLTFEEQPLDLSDMETEIARWEPRAAVIFEQSVDTTDELIAHVDARVQGRSTP